jgi:CSLREA domain-containing protein
MLIRLFVMRRVCAGLGIECVNEPRRRALARCAEIRSSAMFSLVFIVVGIFAVGIGQASVLAAINGTLTVNTTNDVDDGSCDAVHCSLREAINAANAHLGLDTIAFNIPGPAPHTIFVTGDLPTLNDPVTIDGTTSPDFSVAPVIELRGDLDPGARVGIALNVLGGNSTVRGLVIGGFNFAALILDTGGSNTIQGNYIGTDVSGTVSAPNGQESILVLNSANNLIGGTSPGARNLIVHNYPAGSAVDLRGGGSSRNAVQGNLIGTDVSGLIGLAYNAGGLPTGITISDGSNNLIGGMTASARNVISGHSGPGVVIQGGAGAIGNVIEGNYIGTDVTGLAAVGNREGVVIQSPGNTIGVPGAGNLLSGNVTAISVQSSGNVIQGNLIGTNSSGAAAIQNIFGILVAGEVRNNLIGGTVPGAGNVISGNHSTGLSLGTSNTVQGNKIGTDISGHHALGNGDGIVINGSDNVIGGTEEGARNIISGSGTYGVTICTANNIASCIGFDQHNRIQGNYVGTDVTGTVALGNFVGGIVLVGSNNLVGGDTTAAGNLVSGNGGPGRAGGVVVDGTNNRVIGNYIGTDVTGATPLMNEPFGVSVGGSNNIIGGLTIAERNVISGNHGDGVVMSGAGNHLEGNYIGTDASGIRRVGNLGTGVTVGGPNVVGGTATGAGNVISSNEADGVLVGDDAFVQGNHIGTGAMGTDNLGNGRHGVFIRGGSRNIVSGNVIAHNAGAGVAVVFAEATGNAILSNSIFDNSQLGIDLNAIGINPDGVTLNDPGDGDAGANNLQNFPVLTSAVSDPSGTTVSGTLNSNPSATGISYTVELFSNPACDPSTFGQGATPLGAATVTTDAGGNASFTVTLATAAAGGSVVTATATDPSNNTSEFSGCAVVTAAATNITLTPSSATNPVGSTHTVTATVTKGTSPETNKTVTFHIDSGPNIGASATGVTDTGGQATFTYTDGGGAGMDSISATVTDDAGALKKATSTKTWVAAGDPTISARGTVVSTTEASPFIGQVAGFTDPDTAATASEYSASIDWGDATPATAAAISDGSGRFMVSGTHTYAAEGTYTVTTTITDVDNTSNKATITSNANVADASISARDTSISATEGNAFSGQVAGFSDPDMTGTSSEYSATINWGDGTNATPGAITGSGGNFTVSGNHTYAEEGPYNITAIITDVDNASNTATASTTVSVADAALSAKPACPATSSQTFNGPTATFADAASPFGTLSDFSATVTWGDGTSSAGMVSGLEPYTVRGSHTYASTGAFTIVISITDIGGRKASTSCTPIVYGLATGGAFVVGDKSATGSVFFWGAQWAQWAKNNSLSGGTAPSSFKGFVDGATLPACGFNWTTDPGSSSHPPATIPAYMAVIVSSSITQSGSLVSGNAVHVVIVKTKPGYAPDPGHPGTGTVVAVIC